ncbi:hypothetical protein SLH49_20845 [Cognatiyoonia sp. IB215446]|uniref:hypothetical protein n=1 Tax=Cognatiyoonia sp. IB215446 TaxID=3097355 RepID=UPI002A1098EB|nr:hypothetical protein [Cognatiyoonia sp. IB215446]MDX8350444.1 hypothetical protein [Cognatiyoonia sp. IB215446]
MTDQTIIPSDATALIATVSGDLELALAHGLDDADVAPNVQLLCAVLLRRRDRGWTTEMIE